VTDTQQTTLEVYMKKNWFIIAFLAALVLLFSGCGDGPNNTGDDDEEEEETRGIPIDGTEAWWVAPSQIGRDRKYPDNRVPVIGENDDASYVHIFFTPPNIPNPFPDYRLFQITIVLEYEALYEGYPLDSMWQCAFDPYGTWARGSTADDYIELIYPFDIYEFKVSPGRIFTGSNWDETKLGNGKTELTIREMTGLCIQIPIEEGFDAGFIKIHDVSFANSSTVGGAITGPHPPSN
jgi:hypothetical protein